LSGGRFSQPSATVMNDVYLFELSSQRTAYLSARQTLIAGNVANANTPTYKALDLKPFSAVLQQASIEMATTNPAHLTPTAQELDPPTAREDGEEYATVSGNSVDVEGEMVKLGEVNRDFGMATGVRKIFRQMFMQALK
jgi:flagellar basal-body rod protein FlgB